MFVSKKTNMIILFVLLIVLLEFFHIWICQDPDFYIDCSENRTTLYIIRIIGEKKQVRDNSYQTRLLIKLFCSLNAYLNR